MFADSFTYIPETGQLLWKVSKPGRGCRIGSAAGTVNRRPGGSYRAVCLLGKKYYVHRVAWEMANGPIPPGMQIDHINGDTLDNRIANLRAVSISENQRNSRTPRNNTSGHRGVARMRDGKYRAYLQGKHLGCFASFDEAATARVAEEQSQNYHANHGRKAA